MSTGFYLLDNAQPTTQQYGYPRRGAVLSGTCIIHTAECALDNVGEDTSAEGTAEFIRTRSDYGSYHTLVDSDSIIEMAPYEYETWQDSETNPWAVGLSCACQADNWHLIPADRRDRIYRNLATAAADFVTYMKTKSITVPLRRITGAEARARVPGFCAHGDSGVDRHDPGAQFDWDLFFAYTRQALGGAAITTQSTTTTDDPLEEIMSFFKDKAEASKWMQDQVIYAFKNSEELRNTVADAVLKREVPRYVVKEGQPVVEKGRTTNLAWEAGNRNQLDSRVLGAANSAAAKLGVDPAVLADAIAAELVKGSDVTLSATVSVKEGQ